MGEPIGWSAAEAAVGVDDPGSDWKLVPEQHAASLPVEAGSLKRILSNPGEIPSLMERYTKHDEEADRQQARYRSARRWLVRLAYAAAGTGPLALSLHLFLNYVSDVQILLVAVHASLILAIIGSATWINSADPRSRWLAARGEAELLRVALFKRVLANDEPAGPSELALPPLQLAYFRRYQLDVQLRFFEGRGKQLTRVAGISRWYTGPCIAVVVLALICAALIVVQVAFEYGVDVPNAIILIVRFEQIEPLARWSFLALGFSSIYAIVLSQQDISEDRRNGTRYLALYRNLKFLKEEAYERVRRAAEAGDKALVEKFVGLIHDQMVAEQNEWISYNKLVSGRDGLVAGSSAMGLVELFADRFKLAPKGHDN